MSADESAGRVAAEARARVLIDRQLTDAGWSVQDKKAMNLFAAQGVAVREVTLKPDHGRADYLHSRELDTTLHRRRADGSPRVGSVCSRCVYRPAVQDTIRPREVNGRADD